MSKKDNTTLLHTHIAPLSAYYLSRGILSTCKLTVENADFFEKRARNGKNMIFVSWHNRLLVLPYYYYFLYNFTNLAMMVSHSKDGEIMKRLLEKYKIEAIRGSSSRGGSSAVKTMIRIAKSGKDTAVALDGSKGPRYEVQPGALLLAQLTGLPLVPLTYDTTRKKVLNTWDKMIIPLPFGHIHAKFADPIFVPREAKDLEPYRFQLQETMNSLCEEVCERVTAKQTPKR